MAHMGHMVKRESCVSLSANRTPQISAAACRVRWIRSSVYSLAIADGDDQEEKAGILDLVDHTGRADADTPCWASGEFLAACGARVGCELAYCIDDARLLCAVDLGELLLSNPQDLDRVAHAS